MAELPPAPKPHAEKVRKAPARKLQAKPKPPNCNFDGVKKPDASSGTAGANADPELLEAARLELERDCYKKAERKSRKKLEKLQKDLAN